VCVCHPKVFGITPSKRLLSTVVCISSESVRHDVSENITGREHAVNHLSYNQSRVFAKRGLRASILQSRVFALIPGLTVDNDYDEQLFIMMNAFQIMTAS
jgi:hypothetical protein